LRYATASGGREAFLRPPLLDLSAGTEGDDTEVDMVVIAGQL
jgi:hypothetical protein